MGRQAKGGLSEHPKHGFRVTLGKKSDGKPRLFWLGKKRGVAEHHASLLRAQFDGMKLQGRDVWIDDDLQKVNWWLGYIKRSMAESQQTYTAGLADIAAARQRVTAQTRTKGSSFAYQDIGPPSPP